MNGKAFVHNSADAKQVETAAQKEKLRREREVNDLKALMGTPHGRRFIRRQIVDIAGVYRSTYLYGPTGRDSDKDFLEGARNVGLQLLSEVQEHCPELWLLAEKEHNDQLRLEGLGK